MKQQTHKAGLVESRHSSFEPGSSDWAINISTFFVLSATVLVSLLSLSKTASGQSQSDSQQQMPRTNVPDWVGDAVFYQIFPERFRNGDPSNDPTRESLEYPERMPASWSITPWTADWYRRADWEVELGPDFYEHGVFDRRLGGDLQGVIDRLGYLADLGVNTLYFNPLFDARSLHKYDGNSFHHIDPHFGPDPMGDREQMKTESADARSWKWTKADRLFLQLIQECHSRDIRVIIDGVFNHTGRDFFAFQDLVKHQQTSKYRDWYIVRRFDNPNTSRNEFQYEGWWGVKTLPVFQDSKDGLDLHAGPKKYIFDATKRWMDPNGDGDPSDGVDGWRLDVAGEVPVGFWTAWNKHVRELNPAAYTVAEMWDNPIQTLERGGFSATMNYHGFAFPIKGYFIEQVLTNAEFSEILDRRRQQWPTEMQLAMQNLVDSHDTDRVASMIVNAGRRPWKSPERYEYDTGERVSPRRDPTYSVRRPTNEDRRLQRLLTLFQMTYVGAPMIYYGTEAGMWGADDPDDRQPMVWADLKYEKRSLGPDGQRWPEEDYGFDAECFASYQNLVQLRRKHGGLRSHHLNWLTLQTAPRLLAMKRWNDDEVLVVLMNRNPEPQPLDWEELCKELGGHEVEVVYQTGDESDRTEPMPEKAMLRLGPYEGAVLRWEQ